MMMKVMFCFLFLASTVCAQESAHVSKNCFNEIWHDHQVSFPQPNIRFDFSKSVRSRAFQWEGKDTTIVLEHHLGKVEEVLAYYSNESISLKPTTVILKRLTDQRNAPRKQSAWLLTEIRYSESGSKSELHQTLLVQSEVHGIKHVFALTQIKMFKYSSRFLIDVASRQFEGSYHSFELRALNESE